MLDAYAHVLQICPDVLQNNKRERKNARFHRENHAFHILIPIVIIYSLFSPFFIYSVGDTPYIFLKAVAKWLGVLNPT